MLPSYDIWSIFITSEKKIFCFTHFSRNDEDFEISQLKKFLKLYYDAQKLFNDNWHYRRCCFKLPIYVIFRYSYYFQATFSLQGCSVKKKLMWIFRDHIFNAVPKKFADFYWSLKMKNSTVNLKFEWNMAPIYLKK